MKRSRCEVMLKCNVYDVPFEVLEKSDFPYAVNISFTQSLIVGAQIPIEALLEENTVRVQHL